jgi:methylmalonyl-CoA mutase N-terminal domain/subunit
MKKKELKNHYQPEDLKNWSYEDKLGDPGEYPYTRGVQHSMYRSRLWTMRQYAGFGTAEDTNRRFHYLLKQGQMGLSTAFDLPTQMGYDSDHQLSRGEVGRVGVAIDSLEDMERLLEGIPLDQVSTSMTINATAFILLGLYICVAHLHLPSGILDETCYRHHVVLRKERSEMEYDQRVRVSHSRSRQYCGSGSGVYNRQRNHVCSGCIESWFGCG